MGSEYGKLKNLLGDGAGGTGMEVGRMENNIKWVCGKAGDSIV